MVSSFITWLSFSIILLRFSPLVVCAMFLIAIPYFILNLYFAKASFHLQYNRAHDQRVANYLSSSFTDRRSLPEIITRDLWLFLQSKWSALANKFMQQDISLLKRRNRSESAIIGFTYAGYGGVNLYIILKCLLSVANCTVGQVIMYIQSFSGGVSASTQIMQKLSAVYEGSCYMQNYQEFLERQNAANHKTRTPGEVPDEIDSIECREVSFIYPGAPTYALQNVSLVFRKGESTLLVGSTGAGKTTLARLLVGLYTPTGGQILINGRDMQDYDLTLLRKRMSIIFQDFVRYALTAEENIALGSIEGMEDKKRIVTAATAARLDKIIARLPNGYATMLGKEFRDGQDLSLGEWQRVCLARLFMRNASVMIYDEPSASLDIETESELLREINASALNKICVLISHRMLRADIADRIVVIEEGKVVEKGSHNALVNLDGRYARLWKMYHQLGGNGESNGDHNILARSVCK
jgi:ABC-type multidrug transport system fused ATPase/permease subunit